MPSRKSVQAAAGAVVSAINDLSTAEAQAGTARQHVDDVMDAFRDVITTLRQAVDDLETEVMDAAARAAHASPEDRGTLMSTIGARITAFVASVNEPLVVSKAPDAS
jgi:signal transduction histidine kinase